MIPTIIGALVLVAGVALLFRPPSVMLAFVLFCTLIAASSAIDLPALGGSSIPPGMLALVFMALRLCGRDVRESSAISLALSKNSWLLMFCVYCAATAFVLPRIFAGRVDLIPMGRAIMGFQPLQVSAQNTTQAVYMLGTAFAAVAATAFATRSGTPSVIIKSLIVITWIHALTGLLDLAASSVHFKGLFDFVRTGAYAQLDQEQGGFHRISGMASEPSAYATIGGGYFVLMCELWLRRIMPRWTGPAALVMAALLIMSTSSTAYTIILAYVVVLGARGLLIPGSIPTDRAVVLLTITGLGALIALTLALLSPRLTEAITGLFSDVTFKKAQTLSGVERGLWAKQGLDAMTATRGLGVGVGSFRSSSLFTAILGSVGPAGLVVFGGYCLQVAKLGRKATYVTAVDLRSAAGAASGWAALLVLAPAAFIWPSADPGLYFALMAGLSLGWRSGVVAPPRPREPQDVELAATRGAAV